MSGELSQRFNVSEGTPFAAICASWRRRENCSGSMAGHCRFPPPLRQLKRAKACRSTQAGGRPRRRRPDPAGTGGDCRWRHHHRGDDRLFTRRLSCTVVTHSPGIAVALVDHPRIEVILLGGRVFKHSVVAVGAETLAGMARINADLFFMGVTGVHPRAGFTTGDYEEAGIKRALTARAAETVVMASREKLNAASAFAIGELSLASTLIVDGEPDAALRQQLLQSGVEIVPVQR